MFSKPGNRVEHGHCGLVIYIHNQFNVTDITDTVTVNTMLGIICVWKYLIKSLIRRNT